MDLVGFRKTIVLFRCFRNLTFDYCDPEAILLAYSKYIPDNYEVKVSEVVCVVFVSSSNFLRIDV
jgi:hypothetical protein